MSVSKVLEIAENKATKRTNNFNSDNSTQNTTVETTINGSFTFTGNRHIFFTFDYSKSAQTLITSIMFSVK